MSASSNLDSKNLRGDFRGSKRMWRATVALCQDSEGSPSAFAHSRLFYTTQIHFLHLTYLVWIPYRTRLLVSFDLLSVEHSEIDKLDLF